MTIKLSMPDVEGELKPRITVVGVGGAGGNAVNNMIDSNLAGVEFLVCNTDAQALGQSKAERRIQLGVNITQGLGAGARPDVGRAAAEEALEEVLDHLSGSHMVFITAGMGGGTGTGAGPVIAKATREQGILTVGVVTKPFHFEGLQRMRLAEAGIEELTQHVDTLIIIPNQNLFRVANEKTTFADAFNMADNVLYSGVRGVTDLMVMPGLINLDFADVRTVMSEMGKAMMGTGESEGDRRAIDAAEAAISNPLLEDITMEGARGVLINITGGPDMTLFEVDEAANRIREEVDPEANILFGSTFDESMEGRLRVSVVATGIDASEMAAIQPEPSRPARTPQGAPQPAPETAPAPDGDTAGTTAEPQQTAEPQPTAIATPAPAPAEPQTAPDGPSPTTSSVIEPQAALSPVAAAPTSEPRRPKPSPAARIEPSLTLQRSSPQKPDMLSKAAPKTRPAPPPAQPQIDAGSRRTPFIPPRPMSPTTGGDTEAPVGSVPTPTESLSELGLDQPSRRRSLFERMTGVGRGREEDLRSPAVSGTRQPVPPRPQTQPETAPQRAPQRAPAKPEADAAPASTTEEPQAVENATTPSAEEEVLDIPAFLRRQAN